MRYVLLISHGEFAPGLHRAIEMLAGSARGDVLSTSLKNGMGADEFAEAAVGGDTAAFTLL